jgi:hypothetical protein
MLDGIDPTGGFADLEDLGQSERRLCATQFGHQDLAADDVLGTATGMQDPQDPILSERVDPCFAAMAEHGARWDCELLEHRDEGRILREAHSISVNDVPGFSPPPVDHGQDRAVTGSSPRESGS